MYSTRPKFKNAHDLAWMVANPKEARDAARAAAQVEAETQRDGTKPRTDPQEVEPLRVMIVGRDLFLKLTDPMDGTCAVLGADDRPVNVAIKGGMIVRVFV